MASRLPGDTIFFAPRAWVTAVPETLPADGASQAEVTIRLLDQDGLPECELPETITTTLGILDNDECAA
jgi:hypothetical protein